MKDLDFGLDFGAVFRTASSPLAVLDRMYRFVEVAPFFCNSVGAERDHLLGASILDAFPETGERHAQFTAAYERGFAGESVVLERQYYSLREDAADPETAVDRWWTVHITPLPGASGRIDHIVLVADDRTAEVQAERMNAAITAELQHRMGNTLALIGAIARRTFAEAPRTKALTRRFEERLSALAAANRLLTGGHWNGITLLQLARRQLETYAADDQPNVSLTGPEIRLRPAEAQAMSMALHELATNAAKYGALNGGAGRLAVKWKTLGSNGFELEWREDGVSAPATPAHTGFGSILLTQILPVQLQGEAERSFGEASHVYRLRVPERADA